MISFLVELMVLSRLPEAVWLFAVLMVNELAPPPAPPPFSGVVELGLITLVSFKYFNT